MKFEIRIEEASTFGYRDLWKSILRLVVVDLGEYVLQSQFQERKNP